MDLFFDFWNMLTSFFFFQHFFLFTSNSLCTIWKPCAAAYFASRSCVPRFGAGWCVPWEREEIRLSVDGTVITCGFKDCRVDISWSADTLSKDYHEAIKQRPFSPGERSKLSEECKGELQTSSPQQYLKLQYVSTKSQDIWCLFIKSVHQ